MTECIETVHLMNKISHKQVSNRNNHLKDVTEEMLITACFSCDSIRALLLNEKFMERSRKFRLPNAIEEFLIIYL